MDSHTVLRAARKARGWSQSKLAARARMTQSDVSAIENGRKPYPAHAKRLAEVFKMEVDELFPGLAGRACEASGGNS
jgi:transcriptional regulator with XRE-family HTH domain